MDKTKFEAIKTKYGQHASWAIWDLDQKDPRYPKRKCCLSLEDYDSKRKTITEYVFVALNPSSGIVTAFSNFHVLRNDNRSFKGGEIRNNQRMIFAIEGFKDFKGAYLTDLVTDRVNSRSKEIKEYLKNREDLKQKYTEKLEEELTFVGCTKEKTLVIAFGDYVDSILKEYLKKFKHVKVKHYSCRQPPTEEEYREEVKAALKKAGVKVV